MEKTEQPLIEARRTGPFPADGVKTRPEPGPQTEEEPIRGEHFSLEHLQEYARQIAIQHAIGLGQWRERLFLARFHDNSRLLAQAHQTIVRGIQQGETITPDAEWLIDNFYIVEEQLREIRQDLPRRYYRELPKLAGGSLAGYPRVYALALELIAHTDNALDEEALTCFVSAYQNVAPLTMGEVWAVPIMLRLGLVENLRRLAFQMLSTRLDRANADHLVDDLLRKSGNQAAGIASWLASGAGTRHRLSGAFVMQMVERLREQGQELAGCLAWLEQRLKEQAGAMDEVIRHEHQRQAANQVSVGNAITSMRLLSSLDWAVFFERTSLVEEILRQDPAGTYARMDFASRDRYRHVVEKLARRAPAFHAYPAGQREQQVAWRVVQLARRPELPDPRHGHVGYYLIDLGREQLELDLRFQSRWHKRCQRWLLGHPTLVYLGSIGLLTAAGMAGLLGAVHSASDSFTLLVVMGLALLLPVSDLAVALVNYLTTTFLRPRVLAKLAYKDGIPPNCQTMVVIPTMLSSAEGVQALLQRLEIHYLANPDAALAFALLTDFADASSPEMPDDSSLLSQALAGIRELNGRYPSPGPAAQGAESKGGRFYLFHRARRWNPIENKWMGWERKRGKLLEFNRLLRGAVDTTYVVQEGDLTQLAKVKYVLTLDSDTQLPRDAAKQLIGTLAHPLNQARFDPQQQRVVAGYAILQPRVSVNLSSAARSLFARIFSGNPGMDPYTTAVSDVYQDLFGEGSFTGKGIYDVDAFEAAVGTAFPENRILSHDLIEGCHARVALVTDIVLFDEFPARYHAYARRQHRWARGDWQLLPWLGWWVPTAQGKRRNPLTLISRWKIFDNLRRSLVAPALLAVLAAGWCWLPSLAWCWTITCLLVLAFPVFAPVGTALVIRRQTILRPDFWRDYWPELRLTLAQVGLTVTFLAHQAFLMGDAILRTLVRLFLTRRNLLEWEPASATENRLGHRAASFLLDMWFAPLAAVVLLALVPSLSYPAAVLFLFPWLLSPLLAYWLSRPSRGADVSLNPDERQTLRYIGRKTWSYFERFVVPEDHWLPPDNYQEHPKDDIAHRLSPTNEGLYLLSALAAHDFGYVGHHELADMLEKNFDSLEKLERHRGHVLNWYDSQTLKPLTPRYVSTVDSGNLAACLLTLRQGLLEKTNERLFDRPLGDGVGDTARLVKEALLRVHPPGARFVNAALDRLEETVEQILAKVQTPPADLRGWDQLLAELERLAGAMQPQIQQFEADFHLKADDLRFRVQRLVVQVQGLRQDFQTLLPWVALADSLHLAGREVATSALSKAQAQTDLDQSGQALWDALTGDLTLQGLMQIEESSEPEFAKFREVLAERLGGDARATGRVDSLYEAVWRGAQAAAALVERYNRLASRCETLVAEMDFRLLYDQHRRLFSIGFSLEDGRLDRPYYDLLATEARLASFLAIAKGDAETRHWFQLGRPLTQTAGVKALLSWGGTMFEYLMPALFTRNYPETLLEQTCRAVVERQIEYGRQQQIPWGISESAYGAFSATLHYHYQSFGVPGLGLKRGLAKDLVISPYATALALMVQPRAALANFQLLAREGGEGKYGFYEAIDYTPSRIPPGHRSIVVRSHMAHHQGMTLAAIANVLGQNSMQRRFHAQPLVRATEFLLQERLSPAAPLVQLHGDEMAAVKWVRDAVRPVSRRLTTADTPTPRTHMLSNGHYSVLVTNAGTGYSSYHGVMVTRWRPDTTCDSWGHFIYLRDLRSGLLWSAGFQPVCRQPDRYEVIFSSDKAEFRRQDGDLETHLELAVSPERNAEVRQLTLTNHSRRSREVEVTSYAEVALAPLAQDLAHPAFSKLFIQTEFVSRRSALLASRRRRSAHQEPLWAAYVLAVDTAGAGPVEYATDRAHFLGRGRTVRAPAALEPATRLTHTSGAVLDPILSLRRRIHLGSGQTARLAFSLAVAHSRDEALALADQYHDPRVVARTLELAWAHSQLELRHLRLSPGDAHLFQRLAAPLIYPSQARRAPAAVLAANHQGQQSLWRYGISGDHPILLVRLTESDHSLLVRELLLAHEYWRSKGLIVDLVVLNEHPPSYQDSVQEQLLALVQGTVSRGLLDKPGGIFLLRGTQVTEADRVLLQAVASILLYGERGPLARQLDQPLPAAKLPPQLPIRKWEDRKSTPAAPAPSLQPRSQATGAGQRLFCNGLGSFSADGREYVIYLSPGVWTPAPWVNVIANPHFGFLVSEAGSGYTWSENSRENKLTPWANDPVTDAPGEALYLRDEETGLLWSPTPLPVRDAMPYTVRHCPGSSHFEHHSQGIAQELLVTSASADPVKFVCLKLRNDSPRARALAATFYAEWVLGVDREQTQLFVVTEVDDETGALLARNAYNQDFGQRIAFLTVLGRQRTLTGDRTEFFGRNGAWQNPAALARVELSNCTGPGLDPCGAMQTKVRLQPGQETEIIFLLGQGDNRTEVRALLDKYRSGQPIQAASAQTKAFWEELLGTIQVKTPNPALDLLVNRWLLYQTLSCRLWGRSALYQCGGAYGYRDQLQDVMALVYSKPNLARQHILRAAGRQFEQGDVQHWWHLPVNRGIRTRFSDDYLWLPFVTCHYLETTGDTSILDEKVPFIHSPSLEPHETERYDLPETSSQIDTLYGHCLRAVDHSLRFGAHGLPLMGTGDWNDGMNQVGVGGQGESVWVGWFLLHVLDRFNPIVAARGDHERAAYYRSQAEKLDQAIEAHAWDGQWYRRAYFDDGTPLGSAQNPECQIDSLAQSWAVIARGDNQRSRAAMQAVADRLVRREDRLVLLFTPPFDKTDHDPGYIKGYLPGVRENGGQYTHAALWVVQAFALLGEGDRAMALMDLLNPIHHGGNERDEAIYKVEPYVVAADVYSLPPHVGRGGWTWYTGSAAWMYRVALETLLGFQLHGDRLRVHPCIPASWPGFELTYRRGTTTFHVVVENPNHVQRGVQHMSCNGRPLPAGDIPLHGDGGRHEVRVIMG